MQQRRIRAQIEEAKITVLLIKFKYDVSLNLLYIVVSVPIVALPRQRTHKNVDKFQTDFGRVYVVDKVLWDLIS